MKGLLPKCLIKVGGHAIFEYQLKAFEWADEIRMVVGYMSKEVIRQVSAIAPSGVSTSNLVTATARTGRNFSNCT